MVYTDLTSTFTYKSLLTYQNMDKLAENDSFDKFASGTVMIFFQAAAPTGWVKQTANDDKICRVVTGAGGGSDGSQALSTNFTLDHTHGTTGHIHTTSAHAHNLDYEGVSGSEYTRNAEIVSDNGDNARLYESGAGSDTLRLVKNTTVTQAPDVIGESPSTDSQLTNVTYAYIDIIICTKE